MKRTIWLAASLGLIAVTAGCGPTIGDACTTNADCLGKVCLGTEYAPGGYCSQSCMMTGTSTCPTGTACVADALGKDSPGCMRSCTTNAECRTGYVCSNKKAATSSYCVGPAEI